MRCFAIELYPDMKVYGPYSRKDGRQVVILKTPKKNNHRTVSYPKYLAEMSLGRYLDDDETIDHIDGDFTNNELGNLRVVKRSEHCRSHVPAKNLIKFNCPVCGKQVLTKNSRRVTCGNKRCVGFCTHVLGYNKGNDFCHNHGYSYTSRRDELKEESIIQDKS